MWRDKVVWLAAILLFTCGGVWVRLIGIPPVSEVRWSDLIAGLGSIAAAAAAFASWKSAESAKEQLGVAAEQGRFLLYQSHWRLFNQALDEIAAQYSVHFYDRAGLYSAVFPENRNRQTQFTDIGGDELLAWHQSYKNLVMGSCGIRAYHHADVELWCRDYCILSNSMRCDFAPRQSSQLLLGGRVPTGITINKFKSTPFEMACVLDKLSHFAFCPERAGWVGPANQFTQALHAFINAAQSAYPSPGGHSYGVPPV